MKCTWKGTDSLSMGESSNMSYGVCCGPNKDSGAKHVSN